MKNVFLAFLAIVCINSGFAQSNIYTKEGKPILNRKQLVNNCLKSLHKTQADQTALSICECQVQKIDWRFTMKQYRKHTKSNIIDLNGLLKEDSLAEKDIEACYINSGKTLLLQAEGFENEFIQKCVQGIQGSTDKSLDAKRVNNFCVCQLQMVKTKKLTDGEMQTLSNPNSVLFYEMMYKCGDPFRLNQDGERNWTSATTTDVIGPNVDTLSVLNLNGMTYVKVKIGHQVQVWLFDTGATDLLINNELEAELKKENIINKQNYLGVGEYEMANGMVDTCRRYQVNSVQIGNFTVNNVLVSVTDKGKRIIVGKSLLNKFRRWALHNEENKLILWKE